VSQAQRVAMIAAHPRWCGAVHITHLAELMGTEVNGPLWAAIRAAQKAGRVDFWRGWVIAEKVK
jgi:hypothetical protein